MGESVTLCIVGHGPSAACSAEFVDSHDIIVRCKGFWNWGPPEAGKKYDILAGYSWQTVADTVLPFDVPRPSREWWLTLPREMCGYPHCGRWEDIFDLACGMPVRWVLHSQWSRQANHIGRMGNADPTSPSTGFCAVDMAIRYFKAKRISIIGFDSTSEETYQFSDGSSPPPSGHCWAGEKEALAQMADHRVWLGLPLPGVELNWVGRPGGGSGT